ncbi:tetratricopeptide repeat protein [Salegentibacter tibetensis]|uniref:tetratricopeptide repeat protein n=1 Tax=Salegentibacter tibetensis TaxID=2873600 RepID=UPI00293D5739|nr:tetratricopeptide repeat protein [Salegentibacter tibetensis]
MIHRANPYLYGMRIALIFLILFCSISGAWAQSEILARNFFDQGEFEKALKTYEQLLKENPQNTSYFFGLVESHQQLENFTKAEELLREKLNNSANNPTLLIELGHNYELQQNTERAEQFYAEALSAVDARPNYAYSIARTFQKYSLLKNAAETYEKAMELNNELNYNLQLARIYGEQGKTEEMFKNYLELIEANPDFFSIANREFGKYISADPSTEANTAFRRLLLTRLQQNPSLLYNEMLSWLFIQEQEFLKAFSQEKAIYRRSDNSLQSILNLAVMAREAEDFDAAIEIVDYVIEEAPSENIVLQGNQFLLKMRLEKEDEKTYSEVEKRYSELLEQFGTGLNTLNLQIDFANFLAFKQDKKEEGIALLKRLSEQANRDFDKAIIKLALADILVLQEKFNEALIYYSQVQNLVKNDQISQNARFKVAKTSYFKGDFKWAKQQLDVLKSSTSQLIANDAMELSLLIEDNSIEDSTQTALKKYARADLLDFQEKNLEAIELLGEILNLHKGEKIEDEALLKQARLFEETDQPKKAENNYLAIIANFNTDILADNAHYYLAELYANELQDLEKAKEYYEQIIFNFADSIYFVDARKKYRELRGDYQETP